MKTTNEYQKVIDPKLYKQMPKAILAAIAVSLARRLNGESFDETSNTLYTEWITLNQNGIIPQKPIKYWK